ncbi:MAG: hypothetical protein ACT4TC_06225 [Myxococcaceae bacterium]
MPTRTIGEWTDELISAWESDRRYALRILDVLRRRKTRVDLGRFAGAPEELRAELAKLSFCVWVGVTPDLAER